MGGDGAEEFAEMGAAFGIGGVGVEREDLRVERGGVGAAEAEGVMGGLADAGFGIGECVDEGGEGECVVGVDVGEIVYDGGAELGVGIGGECEDGGGDVGGRMSVEGGGEGLAGADLSG